ncbi:MAG: rRNA maturation RNase YbeY [Chloroflexi bacterium]|nr:rRNA maturation RNase YbeY [Chloroflexota bacterium]
MNTVASSSRRIQVNVFPAYRRQAPVPWLRKVAHEALLLGQSPGRPALRKQYRGLSLTIADDNTVRRLNAQYRGLDEPTDVLSFAFDHPGEYEGDGPPPMAEAVEFMAPPEQEDFAGEVILSYPQCRRQAEAGGHAVTDELALLIAHGVLHLLGYDHAEAREEQAMQALEQRILAGLGIHDPRLRDDHE